MALTSFLRPFLAPALALGLVALAPRPASACSCADSILSTPTEVPRNGKLFINAFWLEAYVNEYSNAPEDAELTEEALAQLRLVRFLTEEEAAAGLGGAGGQPAVESGIAETVGVSVTKLRMTVGPDIYVLHPAKLLTPGEWQVGTDDDHFRFLPFQVTDEVDEEPPAVPVLESLRTIERYPSGSTSCGDGPFLGIYAEFSAGDGFLLLDDTKDGKYADTALDGPMTLATVRSDLGMGQLACGAASYEPGTRLHFRVRRVDAAGNVSAWSEPVDADIPEEDPPGCACSLPGAVASTAWPAVLAFSLSGTLWLRRRRRAPA